MKKVIFDTDIGDDIDDLYALNFLVHCPELETLGVTTVLRNTRARAKMSAYALKLFGRSDIPVYAGVDHPILYGADKHRKPAELEQETHDEYGKALFSQYTPEMETATIEEKNAVEFIGEQAKKYGRDLVIFGVGPLTNIALALRTYGDDMKKIGGITIMGGQFYPGGLEYNIKVDPEAAQIVFSSGIPVKAVGLDVTKKCRLGWELDKELVLSEDAGKRFIAQSAALRREYFQLGGGGVMHDVLAVMAEVCDDVLSFRKEKVSVRLDGMHGKDRGTILLTDDGSTIECAHDVDVDKFMKLFWERL